jgi:hypothetical protein
MKGPENFEATVTGTLAARYVAGMLVDASRWFEMDPRPNDKYAFTVHSDAESQLRDLVTKGEWRKVT